MQKKETQKIQETYNQVNEIARKIEKSRLRRDSKQFLMEIKNMNSQKRKSMIQVLRRNSNPQINPNSDNIGNYKIIKKLGEGSYGSVFLCQENKQVYAIKTMIRDLWNDSIQETYQKEVQNNLLLKGPKSSKYIVQMIKNFDNIMVNYQGKCQSCHAIVMKYIEKGSIEDLILKRPNGLLNITVKTLFYEMLQNVNYMHNKGFAHLDIKLENMVMSDNFDIKLIDLSFMANFKDLKDKKYNKYQGTRNYMSYQLNVFEPYDPEKADIFALGVCLFRLFTGKYPFEKAGMGDVNYQYIFNENYEQFWQNITEQIGALEVKKIPENVKQLIIDMLHLDPEKRPNTQQIMKHEWFQTDLNKQIMKQDIQNYRSQSFMIYQQFIKEKALPLNIKKQYTDSIQFDEI